MQNILCAKYNIYKMCKWIAHAVSKAQKWHYPHHRVDTSHGGGFEFNIGNAEVVKQVWPEIEKIQLEYNQGAQAMQE
jgi:hypothetical protein